MGFDAGYIDSTAFVELIQHQRIMKPNMPRHAALPPTLAPRLIARDAAAAYVSVSPNTFDAMVIDGRMPKPKILGGRRIAWDVRALDQAVDALPVRDDDGAGDESWSDVDAA